MKTTMNLLKLIVLAFTITLASCTKEGPIGPEGPAGRDGIDGVDGQDGAPGPAGADGPTRFSSYTESGGLNTTSMTATSTFQPVGPELEITKEFDDSKIEIFFNSNCAGGTFSGGASGIYFEIRINGLAGNYGNSGTVGTTNSEEFISIFDVFEGLEIGDYIVQVYTRTNIGTSTGVLLDPGGWGGRIIAKETF